MLRQCLGLGSIGDRVFHQFEFKLPACLNDGLGARWIAFAGKLHENFVVFAAVQLNRRLRQSKGVDAALDGFERLCHRLLLNRSDGAGAQRERVAGGFTRGGSQIPHIVVLRVYNVAKLRELRGIQIADEDVRIVYTTNLIVADVFRAKLAGQTVHRLVRLLRDGFLHLPLKNQVRAALQVETQLDLVGEIVFQLREGSRRKRGEAKQADKTSHNDGEDE